jgi:uncharacterized LabA/DUF88 family protein
MQNRHRPLFKSVFIDGPFLFHCSQNLNVRIDFRKLKDLLVHPDEHLVSINYYTALPVDHEMDERHRSFLRILTRDLKIRVRSVPLLKNPQADEGGHHYSKGEDILLACDMVKGAYLNHYDIAVLISGDGDFTPAVQQVLDAGKQVSVVSFKNSLSHALEFASSHTLYLNDCIDKITLKKPKPKTDPGNDSFSDPAL